MSTPISGFESLGTADLREPTIGDVMASGFFTADESASDSERGFRLLALALHIDGEPIGYEKLMGLGFKSMAAVNDAVGKMVEMGIFGDPEGNA